ncbi:hypothetical protein CP8484711_0817A, partial [Chlamydia psittaci 84-8471/1]|jgi:hypothetical protein
MLNE